MRSNICIIMDGIRTQWRINDYYIAILHIIRMAIIRWFWVCLCCILWHYCCFVQLKGSLVTHSLSVASLFHGLKCVGSGRFCPGSSPTLIHHYALETPKINQLIISIQLKIMSPVEWPLIEWIKMLLMPSKCYQKQNGHRKS